VSWSRRDLENEGPQHPLDEQGVAALRDVLGKVVSQVMGHPLSDGDEVESLVSMSLQMLHREPPSATALFASCERCDHCGRWIGWGVHRNTGANMPIDITPANDGPMVLHRDGLTMMTIPPRWNESPTITARRFQKHDCGRPGMPVRMGPRRYADPTRELRRRVALRRDARLD